MRRPRSRRLLAAITPILALAVAATSAQAAAGTVHIRGTAYEFNSVHTLLSGATIKVAEYPALSATAASDGTYDLAVPDKAKVTPYIVAAGHHTIYLQTFTTNGVDLKHVNFQTPSDGVAAALTSLLGVPHDADGYPTQCVVVSTFNTKNVRDVDFDDFTGYGAHGVAGATAAAPNGEAKGGLDIQMASIAANREEAKAWGTKKCAEANQSGIVCDALYQIVASHCHSSARKSEGAEPPPPPKAQP